MPMTTAERDALQPYLDRFGDQIKEGQRLVGTPDDGFFGNVSLTALRRALANARLAPPPPPLNPTIGERVPLSLLVPATNYTRANRTKALWLVVHDMEAAESEKTAENVAKWFATPGNAAPRASAHYCVDADSIVPCVPEEHVAWAAKGGNRQGVHYELAGYAAQSPDEWLDAYGKRMLNVAAPHMVDTCRRWGIPLRKIGPADVANGVPGICGHHDITVAFSVKGGHTDPGQGFPWSYLIDLLKRVAEVP